jgi:hypothetical protein
MQPHQHAHRKKINPFGPGLSPMSQGRKNLKMARPKGLI